MTTLRMSFAAMLTGVFLVACSPSKPPTVEVKIPPDVKTDFESAKPTAKFAFYVIRGAEPLTAAEVKKRTVFVCCEIKAEDVGMAMQEIPYWRLFAGAQMYGVFHGTGCDATHAKTEHFNIEGAIISGEEVHFARTTFLYCQKEDRILAHAIEAMRVTPNGVLLVPRSLKAPAPDFTEVLFK